MKTKSLIFWLLIIAGFGTVISCIKDEEKPCECCASEYEKLQVFENEDYGIKFYTAVTPAPQNFMDSINHPEEYRRENPDMEFWDQKNSYLRIDGIEQYENEIRIYKYNAKLKEESGMEHDSIPVWETKNYSNNGDVFDGHAQGANQYRTFASGRYYCEMILTINSEFTDTIERAFCLIREDDFQNSGLVGPESDDPLIK